MNSQLYVDSIVHLSWLFQVRRLEWVWADTPLDRWARTCPRSTPSWWPRTACSRIPWLQTKGQSYTACYSIYRVIYICLYVNDEIELICEGCWTKWFNFYDELKLVHMSCLRINWLHFRRQFVGVALCKWIILINSSLIVFILELYSPQKHITYM